jgi:hypothetical protein
MPEDLATTVARLLQAGDIETATVTVVLKPRPSPPTPEPDAPPVRAFFRIGPVSNKQR